MAYIFTFFQFIQIFWWIFRHNFVFIFTFVNIIACNPEISVYTMANSGLPQAGGHSQRETIPYLIQIKDSPSTPRRKTIPSICGLGARFGCERISEHPNRRD